MSGIKSEIVDPHMFHSDSNLGRNKKRANVSDYFLQSYNIVFVESSLSKIRPRNAGKVSAV